MKLIHYNFGLLLNHVYAADKATCPVLNCIYDPEEYHETDPETEDFYCFKHSGNDPVTNITL